MKPFSSSLPQQDIKFTSQSALESSIEPAPEMTSQPLASLSPVLLPVQSSSPEPDSQPRIDACPEPISRPSLEISSTQLNLELIKQPSLESDLESDHAPQLDQPYAGIVDPLLSDLGQPISSESSHQPRFESSGPELSQEVADGSGLQKSPCPSPESCTQTRFKAVPEPNSQPDKPCSSSPARLDPDLTLPLSPDSCFQLAFDSSPEPSPQSAFESCFQFMEMCSPETDVPSSCQETSLRISPETTPQNDQTDFESCFPSGRMSTSELSPVTYPKPGPSSQPSPKTDSSPTPETCQSVSVEGDPQPALKFHPRKASRKKARRQDNPKPNTEGHKPCPKRKYKRRAHLRSGSSYSLRPKATVVPEVSSCVDADDKLDTGVSSGSKNEPGEHPEGRADGTRHLAEDSDVCSTLNSTFCQTTSSQSEMMSIKTSAPSSPMSSQGSSITCSTSTTSGPSQQLPVKKGTLGGRKLLSKQQFCIYCKKPYTKIARHLKHQHAGEKDVAHALSLPKGSKRRLLLLEQLCKKGNYQHNVEVLRNGNGEIVPKIRRKTSRSMMEYLPCQYCLAFYLRRAILKHERSCKMKSLQSFSESSQQQVTQSHSNPEIKTEPISEPLAQLSPAQVPSQSSSPELGSQANLDSSPQASHSLKSNLELLKHPSLECHNKTDLGPSSLFGPPCADSFSPLNSDLVHPPTPEGCHQPDPRSSPETSLQPRAQLSYQEGGCAIQGSPDPSTESLHQNTFGTVPEPTPQPHLGSMVSSDPDLRLPLTLDLCLEPTFSASPEPSPQSCLESCLQFIETCSAEKDHPNSCPPASFGIGPKVQTSFEAPSSLKSSSELDPLESGPSSQPSLDSCLQAVVPAAPDPMPTAESQECRPSQHTRSTSAYSLRSKLSLKPRVSPYVDGRRTREQKPATVGQSTSDDVYSESTQSSCQNNNSHTEVGSTPELKSSPMSNESSSVTCGTSLDETPIKQQTPDGPKTSHKQQFCIYCKQLCTKITLHLMQEHAGEPDVAHALRFRKGSKRRLLLLDQIRNKGNYMHNVEVLQSGTGELITNKRPTGDYSLSDYMSCQYCLAFYVSHLLWRHERKCKMRNSKSNGGRKRVQAASTKLPPLQGHLPAACEEIIDLMHAGDVLDHIKEDSLIRRYGDKLFGKHGHNKRGQAYISQRMRELSRFMLAVKEADPGVQHLQEMFTPSRFDLAINCAKKVSGFDESSNKLKTPSLALTIGYSLRQVAEILCGESFMVDDAKAVASVKEFIGLLETNWISCVRCCNLDSPEGSSLETCLDSPATASPAHQEVVNVESPLRPEVGTSPRTALQPDTSLQLSSLDAVDENVDCNESEQSMVMEQESEACSTEMEALTRSPTPYKPSKSPAAARRRKSQKKVKINLKFSSFSCLKATTQTRVSSSKSKGSTKSRVRSVTKVKTSGAQRRISRKQFCFYCKSPATKIARHLGVRHANEKEVAHALSFPKGSKTRQLLLQQLRNKGNYQHNLDVLQNRDGEIIPLKRTKRSTSLDDYESCPDCLGFFLKSESGRHWRSCKMREDGKKFPRKERSRSAPVVTFALHDCLSEACRDVVRSMRDDDISKHLRNDALICKFGNKLCQKREHAKPQPGHISQKMRELGRFMLAVKELDPSIEYLDQVCAESRFSLALEAAKKVGCFDQQSNKFKASMIAMKLGYSLRQATEIGLVENVIGEESAADARKFIKLLETDWVAYISAHSCAFNLSQEEVAGLAEDVLKLHDFLSRAEEQAIGELMESPSRSVWKKLRDVVLSTVTLFNRGRKGTADKILLQHYRERTKEPLDEDKCETLTKVQQCLNNKLIKIETTWKDGSMVPVLLTERMESSLDVLNKYREHEAISVPPDNHHLFPRMVGTTFVTATGLIKDFVQLCGAKKPESFSSTHTHKCVATIFQILSLNDGEMRHIAELVGDGGFNWEKLNENPLQLAEICSLLLKMDQDTIPHGANSQDSSKVATSAKKHGVIGGNMTRIDLRAAKDKRRKWSVEEQLAVKEQMAEYISLEKVPGKRDCLDCIKTAPDVLKCRTWRDVKYYVYNIIQSSKKRTKLKQMEADSDDEDQAEETDVKDAAADGPPPKRKRPRPV